MTIWRSLAVLTLCLWPAAMPADASQAGEQGQMRRAVDAGSVRSLREVERRVLPTMQGTQYLGPEYDSTAMVYRLKFIRDGRVLFVDVDARSGRILGQTR